MAQVLTNNQHYSNIANTIRQMKGVTTTYKPREMASALKDIYSNEVEGVPPLSFEANGNNLLNYRIDGASGGVGDRTKNLCTNKNMVVGLYSAGAMVSSNLFITSDFIPVEYGKTYTASLFDLDENRVNNMVYEKINANKEWIGQNSTDKSITINDENIAYLRIRNFAANSQYITNNNYKYQLEEGSTATDYEPYGYKVPVVVSGKNLLKNVSSTVTFQGVKFTINEDKSITLYGTANANAWFTVQSNNILDVGQYILTGAVNNTILRYQKTSTGYAYDDTGEGRNINITQKTTSGLISLRITENVFYDNVTIYPMIRLATIAYNTYEPYIEPTTTTIYLDEPIGANESISLSDTNTNIPTIDGTNVLTINTTVQPSNVYIQAPKDSDEIIEIINTLEAI